MKIMRNKLFPPSMIAFGLAVFMAVSISEMNARQAGREAVTIDKDDIGGIVSSANGQEAGVWVIAETKDLPTKFCKIVVTDDRGRYLVPDLPQANYNVWVRGYGLVDSPKVQAAPGKILNLTAVVASNPRAAAQYYPPVYWYSLLQVPDKSEFPGTGPGGNGISESMKTQGRYREALGTDGCETCHQVGDKATREIPTFLGKFESSVAAWDRRVRSGQDPTMSARLDTMGRKRALAMFADWTDRIAAGELPSTPPRPQGQERNVVISEWDWGGPKEYFHDEIATDRRNPALNANGPLYGVHEHSSDIMNVVDPIQHTMTQLPIPVSDSKTPFSMPRTTVQPSPFWGNEIIWGSQTTAHSPMMDSKGRIWITSASRPPDNPAFCKQGSNHPSAKVFPLERSIRQLSVYDPKTKKFILISTCFTAQHLNFAEDANNTLWLSSGMVGTGDAVGWLNTKLFDETGDEQKSQGWTPFILDTNGNGKRDAYVEPGDPTDPAKDKRIAVMIYGVIPSPIDGSIWGTFLGFPGAIIRLIPGADPATTALAEIYEPPWDNPKAPIQGYSPRGLDMDRNGVVWTGLGSGHFASFDRRKCKGPLNGPTATGQHCPEGWTLYPNPGPKFKGITDSGGADSSYYNWVDQFDTFGLGKNTPIATSNGNDALLALLPGSGKFVVLRVPYPMGFYSKGLDGRIDDPKAGWKGRGLWSTYATRVPWHIEGGKGTTSKLVKFQLRPSPLAN